jgi:hypothetical protein
MGGVVHHAEDDPFGVDIAAVFLGEDGGGFGEAAGVAGADEHFAAFAAGGDDLDADGLAVEFADDFGELVHLPVFEVFELGLVFFDLGVDFLLGDFVLFALLLEGGELGALGDFEHAGHCFHHGGEPGVIEEADETRGADELAVAKEIGGPLGVIEAGADVGNGVFVVERFFEIGEDGGVEGAGFGVVLVEAVVAVGFGLGEDGKCA